MDWDAAHARDVAQALAEHYGFPFAEATEFLWRRQLRQAEQAGAQPQNGEDEDEEVQDAEPWGERYAEDASVQSALAAGCDIVVCEQEPGDCAPHPPSLPCPC